MSHGDDLGHGDIEAALEARRELGARYDAELVDGFAERIERAVERRAAERGELQQRRTAAVAGAGGRQLALGIISLVAFIPISIVLGVERPVPGAAGHACRDRRASTPRTPGSPAATERHVGPDTPGRVWSRCVARTRLTGCEPF